jgi:hypothetical protein
LAHGYENFDFKVAEGVLKDRVKDVEQLVAIVEQELL